MKLLTVICYLLFEFPLPAQSNQVSALNFTPTPLLEPYLAIAPEITSRAAVLVDAQTMTVLYAKNPHEQIPPASLTKLMTMHLVMNEINAGKASYDEIIPVTSESWARNQPPRSSLMFLAPGQIVTLREILLGLAVSSGNDAAVAAALRIAPSVHDFAEMMTAEARRLGLLNTEFIEPSGISEFNLTTAADFTVFCLEYIRMHPHSLIEFHSVPVFAYPAAGNITNNSRPNTIVQPNRNPLLQSFRGVDGLKTGYIDLSGYNLAVTAERNGTRFISVILGAPSTPDGGFIRERDGNILLTWAFENFKTVRPVIGPPEPVRLWKGKEKNAELQLAESPDFTASINRAVSLQYETEIESHLTAPLPAMHHAGWLVISDSEGELHRVQLLTAHSYQQGNIFRRIWHSIQLIFKR
ncbi:MAG: D-alanyl-D-alanine carboxypeptidase [Treponema sp.]|nr:D-alanyl-D-alanine carboxypeptidase [Treponema sp.]